MAIIDFLTAVITLPVTIILGLLSAETADVPNYWKWLLSVIYIEISRRFRRKRFDIYDFTVTDDPEKLNIITPKKEYGFESPYPESHLLKAKDAILFYGVNSKTERLIVSIHRRCHQQAEACVFLKLKSGKTYRLVRTTGVEQAGAEKHVFSCGGLQLHYTNPMRKWRLFYNGYMRETDERNSAMERMVHVKFAMIWTASSDLFDFSEDISTQMLAKGLSSSTWRGLSPPLKRFQAALDAYGQTGTIHGLVSVGDELIDHEMYLFGHRFRDLGSNFSLKGVEFHHLLGFTEKNGELFHLGCLSFRNNVKVSSFGYVVEPDSRLTTAQKISYKNSDLSNFMEVKKIELTFSTERSYSLKAALEDSADEIPAAKNDLDEFHQISFNLNGKCGYGIYMRRKICEPSVQKTSYQPELNCPTVIPLTVSFTEAACQISDITGGKGSSLGKLTQLSKDVQTFVVPEGMVVTTSSYEAILTENIRSKIKNLEEIICGKREGNVKEACLVVQQSIIETEFPNKVESAIEQKMKHIFGDNFSNIKLAVRSSATGEDTEQMSAAGQMDTFLGVIGLNEVLTAVKKCWASQFGFIAVQYKRRYGQCLNSPMAVVIQKMVPCDTAGVLFTCDPLTGNPTVMTITANYGLGESVVSGSAEPDTIILGRDIYDKIHIKSTSVGLKSSRIILKDGEGIEEENIADDQKSRCCLSEEMILRLGQLAIKIENYYRSTRDIEWGFYNNNLYIFQSRPVTSGTSETTFEIDHEFDDTIRLENDYVTISHTGEVFPGAVSPLGYQVFWRPLFVIHHIEKETDFQAEIGPTYYKLGWVNFYNKVMINIADLFHGTEGDNYDITTQAILISFFGRVLQEKDIIEVTKDRYGERAKRTSWKTQYNMLMNLALSEWKMNRKFKIYEGFTIPYEKYSTPKELFDVLLRHAYEIYDILMCHLRTSHTSSLWNMLVLITLGKEHGGFDNIVFQDFARLLRNTSKVESVDVPEAMQSLAFHISKDANLEEFKRKTPEEALKWLQASKTTAGEKFRAFLENHGHRCLKELDIYSVPWGIDPTPLVKLLQNLAGNVSKDTVEKKGDNLSEVISQLQVKPGLLAKLKLRALLPLSRRAVRNRELTKSVMTKVVDVIRRGYMHLAKVMEFEGRIPDRELLFFMTLEEIREILETRSPKILSKASQRQRRFKVLNSNRFPEIMKGMPRPINDDDDETNVPTGDNFSMKGVPVSQGIAKAYIRKAITLAEAEHLQPGEILLTHSTDIGWSPYFPILAGVVTELGGLISHGAVVSREYGIPCIAGLHGATKAFQTGDYVLLDGNKGVLQKLTPPTK